MKSFCDSAVTPSTRWSRHLSLSAALLLPSVLVTVPWSPATATSGEARLATSEPVNICGETGDDQSRCNDPEGVMITVSDAEVTEGPGATLDFVVTLSHAHSSADVTMDYEIDDSSESYGAVGEAVAGEDYTDARGTLRIPQGQTTGTISIAVLDDAESEGVERLELSLRNASKATFVRGLRGGRAYAQLGWSAVGTIIPDEDTTAPTVTVRAAEGVTAPVSGHFDIRVEFSELVEGLQASDLQVTNGAVASFTHTYRWGSTYQEKVWHATIVPDDGLNGNVSIQVAAGAVEDRLGNANSASNRFVIAARGASPNGRKPRLACETPLEGNRHWPISVRAGFGSGFYAPEGFDHNDYALTTMDGRRAFGNRIFSCQGGGRLRSCEIVAEPLSGVSGTLVMRILAGAITDEAGRPSQASDPLYVAGDNWTVSVSDATATEGTDGSLDFEVSLNGRDDCREVSVDWATADGTAVAGRDYTAASGTLTFAPGETTKTVSVAILNDTTSEGDETVTLQLSDVVGRAVAIGEAAATGTIQDGDDTAPTLSSATVDGDALTLTFDEALDESSAPSASSFAVTVTGSTRPTDAVSVSGSTVVLTLSSAVISGEAVTVGYTVPTSAGARPIKDNAGNAAAAFSDTSVTNETASLPVVSIAASATPVAEGTAAAFTLRRTGATTAALEVRVSVAESEAAVSGTPPTQVTFEAGSASATLSVATEDDEVVEEAITVTATVSSGTGYTVDAELGSAEVVVNDDDAAPVVTTATPIEVAENATAVATLTATDADTAAEDLTWSIPEGADGGADAAKFALTPVGVLTFRTAKDFEGPDDANADGNYEVTVRVTDGANPVDAALVVRLSDVDEIEPLTATLAKMPETHDGSSAFQFEVHFSEEPRGLSYRTVRDGLFDVTNGRVTKARRLTRGSNLAFVVTVEPTAQADIDIAVLGTAACGAAHAVCADGKTLAAGSSVTVLDARTITLTVADAAVDEGPGATLDFVVSLSRAASGDVTVSYNTTNEGTATEGVDYEAVDSSFVFSAGQTEKTISVAVLDDALDEVSETVNLAITASAVNGVAVSVADNIAIGTIRDVEDVTPTLSSATVDGDALTLTFDEALDESSAPSALSFAVTVADEARSVDAVAISGSAVTLTLSSAVSPGETVTVRYTVPTGAGAKPIKDNAGNAAAAFSNTSVTNETAALPVVSIAASATPVTEGTAAAFTLARTGATTAALEVRVSVAESEAAVSGTPPTQVTFEAGSASATLSVATEDDEVVEEAITVTATVSSGTGYTVDAELGSAEVVVNDDDAAPVVTTATPIEVAENATAVATLTATDADTAAEDLTWSIPEGADGGADAAKFALTPAGVLTFRTAKDFEGPDDANADGNYEVTVRVTDGANPVDAALVVRLSDAIELLTASFAKIPESHDGSNAFEFEIHFSDEPKGLSYKTVRDALFDVVNGTVTKARRLTRGSNLAFVVKAEPTAQNDIEISVRGTESCDATHAVCAADGKMLIGGPSATVQNVYVEPITLSVADAEVEESPGATLDFVVSLSRAAGDDITVYYTAYDGTATAGADYEAVDSSFVLSPGQTEKTVSVVVLDDAHDEDAETVNFWITGVRGLTAQQVVDAYATGTIRNTDPMPKAWIARFGHTVGGQVVDALAGRLDGSPSSHVTFGGMSLGPRAVDPANRPTDAMAHRLHQRSAWDDRQAIRSMTGRDVLLGSSFHLSSGAPDRDGAALTAWGRVATGGFEADVDNVRMDGDVTTGLLGFDAEWDRVLAGVMVSQSAGEGPYVLSEAMGDDRGMVESTLTGAYPYARIMMGRRVSAWGLAGIGRGGLTLRQDGQGSLETDLSMTMGAVGVKGALLDPADENGLGLNVRSDALWVRTESERTTGLASADADVSRLRLLLEGERVFDLGAGTTLTPTGQVGVRVEGGDAETGAGLELGAGMRYTAGAVSVEGQVRALVAHEKSGYEEWGASGGLRVSPDPSGRGLTLSLAPVWGNPANGPERLWTARDAAALAVGDGVDDGGRLDTEVGYGLGIARVPGVLTPYVGVSFAGDDGQFWRSGTRWEIAPGAALGVEATRAEADGDDTVEHGVMLRGSIRW